MLPELQVKWPIITLYTDVYSGTVNNHESFKRSSYPSTFGVSIGYSETSTSLVIPFCKFLKSRAEREEPHPLSIFFK